MLNNGNCIPVEELKISGVLVDSFYSKIDTIFRPTVGSLAS